MGAAPADGRSHRHDRRAGRGRARAPAGTELIGFAPTLHEATIIAARDDAPTAPTAGGPDDSTGGAGVSAVDTSLAAEPVTALQPDAELRLGDTSLTLVDTRDGLAPDALAAVRAEVEDRQPYLGAEAVVAATDGEWVVPSAAIVTGPTGTCLRIGPAGRARIVAVEIVGGLESRTRVTPVETGALRPGDEVEVGVPASQRRCG